MRLIPSVALGALLMLVLSGALVPTPHKMMPNIHSESGDSYKQPEEPDRSNLEMCEDLRGVVEDSVVDGLLTPNEAADIVRRCYNLFVD